MNNKNYIRETIKDINKFSQMLKEAYVFDDEDREDPRMRQQEMGEEPMEGEEEMGFEDNHDEEVLLQIRKLALDGIQQYSEDVQSPEYDTYKKIWMLTDKFLTDKENGVDNVNQDKK